MNKTLRLRYPAETRVAVRAHHAGGHITESHLVQRVTQEPIEGEYLAVGSAFYEALLRRNVRMASGPCAAAPADVALVSAVLPKINLAVPKMCQRDCLMFLRSFRKFTKRLTWLVKPMVGGQDLNPRPPRPESYMPTRLPHTFVEHRRVPAQARFHRWLGGKNTFNICLLPSAVHRCAWLEPGLGSCQAPIARVDAFKPFPAQVCQHAPIIRSERDR